MNSPPRPHNPNPNANLDLLGERGDRQDNPEHLGVDPVGRDASTPSPTPLSHDQLPYPLPSFFVVVGQPDSVALAAPSQEEQLTGVHVKASPNYEAHNTTVRVLQQVESPPQHVASL
jgi:hypothetical protein